MVVHVKAVVSGQHLINHAQSDKSCATTLLVLSISYATHLLVRSISMLSMQSNFFFEGLNTPQVCIILLYICPHSCMCVCVYAHISVYVYVYVYMIYIICIYIHIIYIICIELDTTSRHPCRSTRCQFCAKVLISWPARRPAQVKTQ